MANNANKVAGFGSALPPFSTILRKRVSNEVFELVVIFGQLK
jgi:hypothetical protein